jgi:parallel beta-helix repeat protein
MKLKAVSGITLTLLLIGMLTLAFNIQTVRSEPETTVYVDPVTVGAGSGETFMVDVMVADVENLYSYQFRLSWEPSLLNVTSVTEGSFLNAKGTYRTFFYVRIYNSPDPYGVSGYVYVACILLGEPSSAVASGDGNLATLEFLVKEEGNTSLHLYDTQLIDYYQIEMSHGTEDGYFSAAFPAVIFSYLPEEPLIGCPVTFNASDSYDYNGFIVSYTWDFGDGNITVVSNPVIVHVFVERGIYPVNLTVMDNDGNSCSRRKYVILRSLIVVPDEYSTIQEAINVAISGDTVFVKNGTYHEEISIDKSISIFGEEKTATLINGGILITASDVVVSGFTIHGLVSIGGVEYTAKNVALDGNIVCNGGILMYAYGYPDPWSPVFTNNAVMNNIITNSTKGIHLLGSGTNNTVSGNIATDNEVGVILEDRGNNTIFNNVVSDNIFGIWLASRNNLLRNNNMTDNQYNFITDFYYLDTPLVNDIDTSNTVNNKPVHFLTNKSNVLIDPSSFPDVGYLALINCYNMTIQNLTLSNNGLGMMISECVNITVKGNTLENNMIALLAKNVNGTTFDNNTITENLQGVSVSSGFNNTIINNMLSNNTIRLLPYHWPERSPPYPVHYWISNELIGYSGGIFLHANSNSTVANNLLLNNERGIHLSRSSFNIFRNNTMVSNIHNFGIDSQILIPQEWAIYPPSEPQISPYLLNEIDTSNTVNDKPIYYWINRNGEQVPSDAGYVVLVNSTNMIVKNLTIQNNEQGILLFDTTNTTISNSNITETRYGIQVKSFYYNSMPLNNRISENNITKNGAGISIDSGGNKVSRNAFELNLVGVYVRGDYNLITENIIFNNTLPPAEEWILGYQPTHCEFRVWSFSLGPAGILLEATGNTVCYNTIQDNEYGMSIGLFSCNGGNIIHHNNLINNTMHGLIGTINTWEGGYPSGGNYWSDYEGLDAYNGPYQNETGSDGIGDTSYFVGKWVNPGRACSSEALDQWDQYPLMASITLSDAGTWDGVSYSVGVVSNSTVSDLNFNPDDCLISFNVTGPEDTVGFCRVTIPNKLLWCNDPDQWEVWVNNTLIEDRKVMEDINYTYIYFTYNQSTQNVDVIGVHVIPEFPTWTSILPLLTVLTVAIAICKRKLLKNNIHVKVSE